MPRPTGRKIPDRNLTWLLPAPASRVPPDGQELLSIAGKAHSLRAFYGRIGLFNSSRNDG